MNTIDKILEEINEQADAKGCSTFVSATEYFQAKDVMQARSSEARATSRHDVDLGSSPGVPTK